MDLRSDDTRQQSPALTEEGGGSARNWLDLPRDVAAAILRRVGAVDVLTSAQYVCTTWRGICRDPSMWRHVDMLIHEDPDDPLDYAKLCRFAVDLSQGGLVRIAINHFAEDDLLLYIAERSSQLKHLELACCNYLSDGALASVAAKSPLLEVLELSYCNASWNTVEVFGRCCPLLRTFKLNCVGYKSRSTDTQDDEEARAIAKNMPQLVHLQIFGNRLTNAGLEAIMDACPHLESLDLRQCFYLDLRGPLGKTCAERIKDLRLPDDPTDDYPFDYEIDYSINYESDGSMVSDDYLNYSGPSDYEYGDYDDYDDFTVEDLDFDYIFTGI